MFYIFCIITETTPSDGSLQCIPSMKVPESDNLVVLIGSSIGGFVCLVAIVLLIVFLIICAVRKSKAKVR